MTRDEIIAMAREAGGYDSPQYPNNLVMDIHDLERFAAIVAAKEREASAKVCDELAQLNRWDSGDSMWQQEECAAAIEQAEKQEPSTGGVLFAVEEAIRNGDCPFAIEIAFDAYESERKALEGITGESK